MGKQTFPKKILSIILSHYGPLNAWKNKQTTQTKQKNKPAEEQCLSEGAKNCYLCNLFNVQINIQYKYLQLSNSNLFLYKI